MNLKFYYLGEKSGPVKTVPTGPAPTPMHSLIRFGVWYLHGLEDSNVCLPCPTSCT